MKNKLDPADQALFREAMREVKKLTPKKINIPPPPLPTRKKRKPEEDAVPPDSFSEQEYLDEISTDDTLNYARPGIHHKILRTFRKGLYPIEARLDMHGMIVEEARISLHRFLLDCQAHKIQHVLIIHGKGRLNSKPILKNKLNHWLRESNQVLAFCSAQAKDGGKGSVYVRLKR